MISHNYGIYKALNNAHVQYDAYIYVFPKINNLKKRLKLISVVRNPLKSNYWIYILPNIDAILQL